MSVGLQKNSNSLRSLLNTSYMLGARDAGVRAKQTSGPESNTEHDVFTSNFLNPAKY